MEQILNIQSTPSQAPQPSSGTQDAQNDFSPHLEAALDKNNSQRIRSREQKRLNSSEVQNTATESSSSTENLQAPASESSESQNNLTTEQLESNTFSAQISYSASFELSQTLSSSGGRTEQLRAFSNALFNFYNSENVSATDSATPNALDVLQSLDKGINQGLSQSEINSAFQAALKQQNLLGANGKAADQINGQPVIQGQDKILSQLQQIINNSSETGKVTISQSVNLASSYSAKSNTAHPGFQTALQQQLMLDPDGDNSSASLTVSNYLSPDEINLNSASGNKQNQDLAGLRLDTKQQFYDAKLGEQNNTQNNPNGSEDKSSLNQFAQQNGSSQSLGTASANGEQTNTFAQVVGGNQGIETQTAVNTAKPVILPAHNLAHEQEVLQQLYDKFQVNIRKPETNLNIKLHPAELGEIKIDLTVKEGSIRANVLAQSQHVQEILEKNMLKLKTVLEDQGFTVDEILIASASDSVGDFDLFDSHLFNRQHDAIAPQKSGQKNTAGFQIEEIEQAGTDSISGVNVTA